MWFCMFAYLQIFTIHNLHKFWTPESEIKSFILRWCKTGPAPIGGKKRHAPQGRLNCCRPILNGGPIKEFNFNHFSPLLHFCSSNNELSMNVWKKMMVTLLLKIVSKFQKIRNNSAYSDFCPTFFVWSVCLEQYATGGKNYSFLPVLA